jgi:opacity protein-like surface antigen
MKKSKQILYISLSLFLAAFLSSSLSAQSIELNGYTGWHFGGKIKFYEGEFKINDAQNYGGKLAYGLSETTFVEASYLRADSEGQWRPYSSLLPSETIEMSSNYIHIAGLQQLNYGKLAPYATLGLGVAWFAPKNNNEYRTSTQFSATFGAGVKIFITEMIGIRLQGSMLMPMIFQGVGFGFGTGGVSAGAYSRITPFQGEFSGGLIIRIPTN